MVRQTLMAVVVVLLAVGTGFAEEERYLCVADQATGFAYVDGNWKVGPFNTKECKYVISRGSKATAITQLGESAPICIVANNTDLKDVISGICQNGEFIFSTTTGRYIMSHLGNYVFEGEKFTPYIEIGKCSPF